MARSFAAQLIDALESSWPAVARPNQLPPPGDWQIWLLLAGRGFGKTRTLAEWVCGQVASGQAGRIALVAATAADARDVLVEGQSGILATYCATRRNTDRLLPWRWRICAPTLLPKRVLANVRKPPPSGLRARQVFFESPGTRMGLTEKTGAENL